MKKTISFVLICSLLLAFLSGCSYFDKTNNDDGDNVTDDSAADNNNGNNAIGNIGEELDKTNDLVATLIAYLEQYLTSYDLISRSFADKINDVKTEYSLCTWLSIHPITISYADTIILHPNMEMLITEIPKNILG